MNYSQKMKSSAPTFLRMTMALIILWFGVQQIMDVSSWIAYLPDWTSNLFISQSTFVYLNGTFEIVFGIFMFFGFYTRFVSLLLALHLLDIAFTVGLDATGMRDLGLTFALFTVFLQGADTYSFDKIFQRFNEESSNLPKNEVL